MGQVKLWVAEAGGDVKPLVKRDQIDLEQRLEEMLIARPEMLGDGVVLVGRQLMTEGGPVDLLGIDQNGKLTVYELKRGRLPREAITQAIDYASWLDSLSYGELARRISDHHPVGFERTFDQSENADGFDDWYTNNYDEDQVQAFLPVQIVLAGIGVEPAAERMAHWLADNGSNVEVISFQAFDLDGRTVIAREVEVSSEETTRTDSSAEPARAEPLARAAENQAEEAYRAAYQQLDSCFVDTPHRVHTYKWGVNFALPPTEERASGWFDRYVGVYVRDGHKGQVWLVLRPHGYNSIPDERKAMIAKAESLDLVVRDQSNDELWIAANVKQLGGFLPDFAEYTKAAIDAWREKHSLWLSEQSDVSSQDTRTSTTGAHHVPQP